MSVTREGKVFGWADSMRAASARLGIELSVLKAAKRAGCPNFAGSRVKYEGLQQWIRDHLHEVQAQASSDKDKLTCRRLAVQCDRLEFDLAVRRREYVPKSAVIEGMSKVLSTFRRDAAQKLENELPALVANMTPEEIRPKTKAMFDEVMLILNRLGELLPD